ncbi:hypothetical protein DFH08DRAFT_289687 [Mycena albidolilacea]|uniref:Uncharacterized protein n=1 Tax=Mycena albidolilacea TaxID=1033008 RepID=A0AAD7EMV2_9AGAR|nr:hypothetical protein DFH08DRAFT_289687 [Mycena albidolilacea]
MVSAYTLLELDSRLQCRRAEILWFCGVYFSNYLPSDVVSISAVLESILVYSLVFVFLSPVAILTISQPSALPMGLSLSNSTMHELYIKVFLLQTWRSSRSLGLGQ